MEIAVFSTKSYDRQFINAATSKQHKLHYLEAQLTGDTAVLADGAGTVCVFVNDRVDDGVLKTLKSLGVGLVALRCAGFNNVDLAAAKKHGM